LDFILPLDLIVADIVSPRFTMALSSSYRQAAKVTAGSQRRSPSPRPKDDPLISNTVQSLTLSYATRKKRYLEEVKNHRNPELDFLTLAFYGLVLEDVKDDLPPRSERDSKAKINAVVGMPVFPSLHPGQSGSGPFPVRPVATFKMAQQPMPSQLMSSHQMPVQPPRLEYIQAPTDGFLCRIAIDDPRFQELTRRGNFTADVNIQPRAVHYMTRHLCIAGLGNVDFEQERESKAFWELIKTVSFPFVPIFERVLLIRFVVS
jgi:hypothetical protein